MADQKIKLRVSIKELSFEFEGSRDMGAAVQQGLNQTIGRLMDTQKQVMAIAGGQPVPPVAEITAENLATNGQNGAEKPKARTRKSGGGVGVKAILRKLIAEGYFKEPKSANTIQEKCKTEGTPVTQSSLASRLQELKKADELFRRDFGDGYVYKDTPFNDSDGPPTSRGESAE